MNHSVQTDSIRRPEFTTDFSGLVSGDGICAVYVIPYDIKGLADPVFEHRLVLTTDTSVREVSIDTIIDETLEAVEVPGADVT